MLFIRFNKFWTLYETIVFMKSKRINMKKYITIFCFLIFSFSFAENELKLGYIGDLVLESGEIIENCQVGYRFIGNANQDSSNIVLMPTWFGGLSEHIINFVKKYNFISQNEFLIIAVDALGNGNSSSPSNYPEAMPEFSIKDMVKSQYLLLTKNLKIKHLYGIVGGSMGSFQTFQWVVSYPDFIDRAIPYVCSPIRTSSDKMWLNLEKEIITLHKKNGIAEGETQKIMEILTTYFAQTQKHMSREIDTNEFDKYYKKFVPNVSRPFSIDNRLSQINAMLQHDITKQFGSSMEISMEETIKHIKAEMLIIVSDSDQIVNPEPAMRFAELSGSKLIVMSNECGHLAPGCDIETFSGYIDEFLKK